jgi:hypothetical protein
VGIETIWPHGGAADREPADEFPYRIAAEQRDGCALPDMLAATRDATLSRLLRLLVEADAELPLQPL